MLNNGAWAVGQQQTDGTVANQPCLIEQARHGLEGFTACIDTHVQRRLADLQVQLVHQGANVGHHRIKNGKQGYRVRGLTKRHQRFVSQGHFGAAILVNVFNQEMCGHVLETQQTDAVGLKSGVGHQRREYRPQKWRINFCCAGLKHAHVTDFAFGQQSHNTHLRPACLPVLKNLGNR